MKSKRKQKSTIKTKITIYLTIVMVNVIFIITKKSQKFSIKAMKSCKYCKLLDKYVINLFLLILLSFSKNTSPLYKCVCVCVVYNILNVCFIIEYY